MNQAHLWMNPYTYTALFLSIRIENTSSIVLKQLTCVHPEKLKSLAKKSAF